MTLSMGLRPVSPVLPPVSRRLLDMVEISLRATALSDGAVAKWVREHSVAVEVRTGSELSTAIGASIHPMRLLVHADGMTADELVFCTANLGAGRLVVTTVEHVELLASAAVPHRRQRVLIGMPSVAAADVVSAVLAGPRLDLVGLSGEIGSGAHHFVRCSAAVGDLLVEMAGIRRERGVVLTRIALGGEFACFGGDLYGCAEEIEATLDDACATLRFPRPMVVISAQRWS
ncbi:LysA protein [Mycobacterium sp. 21AC1]|uniref:LysA protein n=1 Tax=[Mycobacterium] appelbergii TaxID=2939269 RepID=UPI002938D2BB|nr:LysA protein [Mycobacterium sp. 21AC1]MDV3129079.1 LysA protein [Mycobacterium sp. 21AC1]